MLKTYWTVKTPTTTLYFDNYNEAKAESVKDYRDKPIKHTVKSETFDRLNFYGVFLNWPYIER